MDARATQRISSQVAYFLPLFSAPCEGRLLGDSLHLKEKPGGNGSANRYRDGKPLFPSKKLRTS